MLLHRRWGICSRRAGEQGAKGRKMSMVNSTGETLLPAQTGIIPICLMHKALLQLLKTLEEMWSRNTSRSLLAFWAGK